MVEFKIMMFKSDFAVKSSVSDEKCLNQEIINRRPLPMAVPQYVL